MKLNNFVIGVFALLFLSSCASNKHLVFFTNTTIGVEVGSEPANGSPAKFIVGYKRQEGVIDPLIPDYELVENYGNNKAPNGTLDKLTEPVSGETNIVLTPQGTVIPMGARTRAHSVLAKMNFGATGGGNGAAAAQFFATGRAADYLAQGENIAAALAGEPSVNNSPTVNLDALGSANYSYLHDVYRILEQYIQTGGPKSGEAIGIKFNVDQLDNGIFKETFKEYSNAGGANAFNINDYSISPHNNFRNIPSYIKDMQNSLVVAKKMVTNNNATHNGSSLSSTQKQEAVDNISKYPEKIEYGKNKISSDKSVINMVKFVQEHVLLNKTK